MTRQQGNIPAGKGENQIGGWAAGIGRFVNVITYPDSEHSTNVIAQLFAEQLGEVEPSGPFIPMEQWMEKVSS